MAKTQGKKVKGSTSPETKKQVEFFKSFYTILVSFIADSSSVGKKF